MAKKEFTYRGKKLDELRSMTIKEVSEIIPSRSRRSLQRGLTDDHKIILKKVKLGDNNLKTHCRDMVILPEMVDAVIKVYNGKEFKTITILPEMIGHFLGEFSPTRKVVAHSSPGVGATKSSSNISVK